jgi:hypothetical protein
MRRITKNTDAVGELLRWIIAVNPHHGMDEGTTGLEQQNVHDVKP